MQKSSFTRYIPEQNQWKFRLKNEEIEATITSQNVNEIQISIEKLQNEIEPKKEKFFIEQVKQTAAFKETMKEIERWEEKMKSITTISNIEMVGKETEEGETYYFFAFDIDGPLTQYLYCLELGEKELMESFTRFKNEKENQRATMHYYFIIALTKVVTKDGIMFQYNHQFPLDERTRSKKDKPRAKMRYFYEAKSFCGKYSFSTYRSFIDDVVQKINEEPSIRIKKLLL